MQALTVDDGSSVVTGNYLKVRIERAAPAEYVGSGERRKRGAARSAARHPINSAICCAADFFDAALDNQLTARGANVLAAALAH